MFNMTSLSTVEGLEVNELYNIIGVDYFSDKVFCEIYPGEMDVEDWIRRSHQSLKGHCVAKRS